MYQELLPRVKNETWPQYSRDWSQEAREAFEQSLDALERAGAIAGPLEWRCTVMTRAVGMELVHKTRAARPSYLELMEQSRDIDENANRFDNELRKLDDVLQQHVRRLWPRIWPRWRQRLRLRRRKKPADR
jgi:hypothetical protein